jgi:S-adenosylmethionine:tRNA ribosyltransferase-isomerase
MKTADFDYHLPPERIAQHPAAERDGSRLMVLDRAARAAGAEGAVRHARFHDLPAFLRPGDLLVANDTRVLPARLFARVGKSGGGDREVEVLLLREEPSVAPARIWSALARPARALHSGTALAFHDPAWRGRVHSVGERGVRRIAFDPVAAGAPTFEAWLSRIGHIPLPPYIDRPDEPEDRDRYQTVFARDAGSVAAPTAGLHFTDAVLAAVRARGAAFATVTLHVGPGTFRPVATENPEEHVLDPEPYRVPPETAAALAATDAAGGRVVAVGTTSVRSLESWARDGRPGDGAWRETNLFVRPPFDSQVVGAMITNFHLPRSSLLFLVSAFAGREFVLEAYDVAVREGYRFYSYGDAMLIL